MTQKSVERRALIVTTVMNCLLTCAGLWVYLATGIQALFLDFFFSFIALLSTLAATVISKVSCKKTGAFPDGLHFLEPLYSVFKTLLIVSLLIYSVIKTATTTYVYFTTSEGTPLNLTPVLPYTIIMFVICSAISINNTIQNRKINNVSTMLRTEAKMNFIDGLQSFVIGIATFLLLLADIDGPLGFLYYTGDFFVTAILVIITIKQPVSEIIDALREILGGVSKDTLMNEYIDSVIEKNLSVADYTHRIYKKGMFINISVRINAPVDGEWYGELLEKKTEILKTVQEKYQNCSLEYIFS